MEMYATVPCLLLCTLLVLLSPTPSVHAAAPAEYGPGEFGSLTLCPAGGRAFMMAWSLACEMKRRKKRSIMDFDPETLQEHKAKKADGYRPATLTEIQKICCNVGCELRDLLSYCDPFGPWNS